MAKTFENYQEMLEEFWSIKVTTESEVQFVRALTDWLVKTESIWAPIRDLKPDRRALASLCDKGVLEQHRKQVRFSHQTVQEFAIGRLFEESGSSLSSFVREHEGAIFSRRTVSAVLKHLREFDRDKYHHEVKTIVSNQPRLHIMFLLIDFMCQQSNPTPDEIEHVKSFIQIDEQRLRVLIGVNNQKNWFAALKADSLPALMKQPHLEQWPLLSVLSNSWTFDWEGTYSLIRDCWSQKQAFDNMTHSVMEHCGDWNQKALELTELVALRMKKTHGHSFQNERIVGVISAASPIDGARIAARVISTEAPKSDSPSRRNSPLENTKDWHDLEAIAKEAPEVFLYEIAPWLSEIVESHHSGFSGSVLTHYAGFCIALDNKEFPREAPVLIAIQTCVDLVSKSAPNQFVSITRPYWKSENAVLHRLYIRGLLNVVEDRPDDVYEYLMEDNRRFSVGQDGDTKHSESAKLIGVLFPNLSNDQQEQLIQRVLKWTQYREGVELIPNQLVRDRESRLHLLTAIPSQYVPKKLSSFIEEEKSQLPDWDLEVHRSHSGWVKTIPPMSHEEMVSANNEALIDAFTKKITDDGVWNRVEGGFEEQGGGEASAEELAKLVESNHERAGAILRLLVDKGVTSNIHRAIEGFEKCDDREFVLKLLNDISPKCDESEAYRASASRILLQFCDEKGLPDVETKLLERWLEMPWDHTRSVVLDDDKKDWKPEDSLLWTNLGYMIVDTDQSYYTLQALTQSLLGKDEPEGDRWLHALLKHLDREVSFKTWRTFCDRIRYVRGSGCTPELAKALIAKLYAKFPKLPSENLGCRLLAQLVHFLDADFLLDIFRGLRSSNDPCEQQAVGELLTLASLLDETTEWAAPLITQELANTSAPQNSGFLVGCAHAISHLWHDLEKPSECAQLLKTVFYTGDPQAINASQHLFWNNIGLPGDKDTAELIVALTDNVDVVGSGLAEDLLGQMADILPDLRIEILNFCNRLVSVRFDEFKRREFNSYEAGPYLVEIAMTLQRFPNTRTLALDLFEQLLRAGLDDADKVLKDVDGIEETTSPPRTPRRRRRRRSEDEGKRGKTSNDR